MGMQQFDQLKDALNSQLQKADLPTSTLPQRGEKTYRGMRHADGSCTVIIEESVPKSSSAKPSKISRPLPLHLELRNHSPTGFAWGYGGSGPAQLALALLMDATDEPTLALRHYQDFKFNFVAHCEHSWQITQAEICAFVTAHENLPGCHGRRDSCPDC